MALTHLFLIFLTVMIVDRLFSLLARKATEQIRNRKNDSQRSVS